MASKKKLPLFQRALSRALGLDQGKVSLSGATGDDVAADLKFDPKTAQYNALVESKGGRGFMSYGKAAGGLNFLEDIWRKAVSGNRATNAKQGPPTGYDMDEVRKQRLRERYPDDGQGGLDRAIADPESRRTIQDWDAKKSRPKIRFR